MRVYLDNNATTPIHPEVLALLTTTLQDVYGNPSSIHKEGQSARQTIEEAREAVSRLVGSTAREIVFTSGGSESNNAAILGAVSRTSGQHLVTTAIEHPSVLAPIRELERSGTEVSIISPRRDGAVDAEAVIDAIRPETSLVAVMLANNETGVVQPVAAIGRACRDRSVHFHCDAVQAAGKIEFDVESLGVDTLSLTAHKMHGPKGIGALYVRRGLTLAPLIAGGSQERRRRAGTENVPLAAAFGAAAALAAEPRVKEQVRSLRDRLENELRAALADSITVNGSAAPRLPNTSSITFHDVDAEGLVIALDLGGVAASSGSACSSGRVEPSGVLLAMGLTPDDARSTVRFSLSRFTTAEEIGRLVELLHDIVPRCKRPPAHAE